MLLSSQIFGGSVMKQSSVQTEGWRGANRALIILNKGTSKLSMDRKLG